MSSQGGRGAAATAQLLRDLLTGNPHYRQQWRARVKRAHYGINQAAIAEVITLYLWESGERSESSITLTRTLKDRVSRALNGTSLSSETLGWIIAAFQMEPGDEAQLWSTFAMDGEPGLGISNTLRKRRAMVKPQRHRTISLFERYFVDGQGFLIRRHTFHNIRAVEDGVDTYIFNHEPNASEIQVMHGGTAGHRYEYGGGLFGVEIVLDAPLMNSQTTALEYSAHFAPRFAFPTEVRRAAFGRTENVDLAVEFLGDKLPAAAWWCVWDDHLGGHSVREERVGARNGVLRRYVPFIEETVVGFRWEW